MNRLVLHIGYPKTATTSIQNGWLYPLGERGLIDYAGKYRVDEQSHEESVDLYHDYLAEGSAVLDRLQFDEETVTVVSHEVLTKPLTYRRRRHDLLDLEYEKTDQDDPFEIPETIRALLEDRVDEVTVWVTLRNQQTLINSMYANYYQYFEDDPSVNQWDRYLQTVLETEPPSIFDFAPLLHAYRDAFGQSAVEILLFEDFIDDKRAFANGLREILGIDREAFFDAIDIDTHENRKRESSDSYIRPSTDAKGNLVKRSLKRAGLFKAAKYGTRRALGPDRFEAAVDTLFTAEVEIDKPTDEQRRAIFDRFAPTNERLHADFGLDRETLRRYEYVE